MAIIEPFRAIRAVKEKVHLVSAPPDSGNRKWSKDEINRNPFSWLHVVKPYLHFEDDIKIPEKHYTYGRKYLEKMMEDGIMFREEMPAYYIYRAIKGAHAYTGIFAAASVNDYYNNVIRKHEHTLTEKLDSLIEHIKYIKTVGSPVLITYPDHEELDTLVHDITQNKPEYNFISSDQVKHNVWVIHENTCIEKIRSIFAGIDTLYIADGHHRSAGSAAYSNYRNGGDTVQNISQTYNFIPVCLVPFSILQIFEYHRLIKHSGFSGKEILRKMENDFIIAPCGELPFQPLKKGEFGFYMKGHGYQLRLKENNIQREILEKLDVTTVENYILRDAFGINDSKNDKRVIYMDGSKGIGTIQQMVDEGSVEFAITLFPVSVVELMEVADHELIMPPKSTWIEPKINTGLLVYEIGYD